MSENRDALDLGALQNLGNSVSDMTKSTKTPMFPLSSIETDPNQPRKHFDQVKLEELADSIRRKGLVAPITIKPHPEDSGKFMLVTGERRVKAVTMLGWTDIPAYVREDGDDEVQIIENIQREALEIPEIAAWVAQKLENGMSLSQVGQSVGKSKAWAQNYSIAAKMPPSIREAYDQGRVSDIVAITELVTLYSKNPDLAFEILREDDITRTMIKRYKSQRSTPPPTTQPEGTIGEDKIQEGTKTGTESATESNPLPPRKKAKPKILVKVTLANKPMRWGVLVANKATTGPTKIWVAFDGKEEEVPIKTVVLDKTVTE